MPNRETESMITRHFLQHRKHAELTGLEHQKLEAIIDKPVSLAARTRIITAGQPLDKSTFLEAGFLCRYLDDNKGHRQLVAFHVPGEFVDLHAYPLIELDHDIASLTPATVAFAHHDDIKRITTDDPELARKLWFSTLLDAAIHRAWLFRMGRLDAVGRVAHFFCETNVRLQCANLSDGRSYELPITQTDLAEICGLTAIHVNRVLRQLRAENLCQFRDGVVTIDDLKALASRGQFDPAYLYVKDLAVS